MEYVEVIYGWLTNVESSFSFWLIGSVSLAIIVYSFIRRTYNNAVDLIPPFVEQYLDDLLVFVENILDKRMYFLVSSALSSLSFSDSLEKWLYESQGMTVADLSNLLTNFIVKLLRDAFVDFGMEIKEIEEKI